MKPYCGPMALSALIARNVTVPQKSVVAVLAYISATLAVSNSLLQLEPYLNALKRVQAFP